MADELRARALVVTRGDHRVLDGVDIAVQHGEIIALMGASGAGKSTLALALAGLIELDHGTVAGSATDRVGLVLQRAETAIFGASVVEDVAAAQRFAGVPAAAAEQHARAALRSMGLDDSFDGRDPLGLSGGEQRRVAIAAVLAASPRIMILDEPSAGLDAVSRQALHRELHALSVAGTSLVVITHDPQEAADLADRLVVLSHGRVVHDGAADLVLGDEHQAEALGIDVAPAVRILQRVAALRGVQSQLVCRRDRIDAELLRVVRSGRPAAGVTDAAGAVAGAEDTLPRHRHDHVELPAGARVEPRFALVAVILLVAALFAAASLAGTLLALLLTIVTVAGARPPASTLRAALRPMVLLAVLLVIAQLVIGGSHEIAVWSGHVINSGLMRAVQRVMQIIGVVLASLALTTVLRPVELADAIAWLCAPLRVLRVPVDDISLMLATALGFVPMLAGELDRLQLAQAARGMRSRGRGPRAAFALRSMLLTPLMVLAVRRSRLTAEAMVVRGYIRGVQRTRWRPRPAGTSDVLFVVGAAIILVTVRLI